MKLSLIQFPWTKIEKGQGFFIPCLDTDPVRELGLKKATLSRVLDARAKTGIYQGFTGVMFYRPRPRTAPPQGVTAG
jgi:hypothetical protein